MCKIVVFFIGNIYWETKYKYIYFGCHFGFWFFCFRYVIEIRDAKNIELIIILEKPTKYRVDF